MKHPFDYHRPSAEQVEMISILRDSCKTINELILLLVPPGRERVVAITKLEECSMWVNKGIIMADEGPVESVPMD